MYDNDENYLVEASNKKGKNSVGEKQSATQLVSKKIERRNKTG